MIPTLTPIIDRDSWLALRKPFVTSTQSPSLFGLQMPAAPTAFELWHIKRGLIDDNVQPNAYMLWGQIFERSIVEIIKLNNPEWKVLPLKVFAHSEDGMGCSFDSYIMHPTRGRCLLEIKMTSYREYKEKYIEDDDSDFIEAPDYYETQCQHELESFYNDAYNTICLAVAIVDTREIKYIWRERDRDFGRKIRERIVWFKALELPPQPDLVKDSDLLARMSRANNTDSVYNGTESADFNIATLAYLAENERQKAAEVNKKRLRSEIILAMGTNNTAWSNNARVSNKSKFLVTATGGKNGQ